MLKCGSWHAEHVEVILSFMLCLNIGLNSYVKAQKSSVDWWCHFLIGRYCWMKSIMLRCCLFWVQKDAWFVVCSCLVAIDVRILLKTLLVVLGLSTC